MYVDYDFFKIFFIFRLFLIVFFWSLLSANFIGCSFGGLINEQGLQGQSRKKFQFLNKIVTSLRIFEKKSLTKLKLLKFS